MTISNLGRLVPVDLRYFWADEARDFTPWLAREESLLLLSSTLSMDLELEGMEWPVGTYRADIVAQDVSSRARVIIENQLGKTDHSHLGQVITYASGLDAKVIIWIAKEFTEEHRQAIDFLNINAAPNLRCFAVEVQLWKIGDSLPAPLFKIVASPNDFSESVKVEEKELTETKVVYLEFWSTFKDYCKSVGSNLRLRKPYPQHWFDMAIGRSNFALSFTANIQKQRVGCEIYISGVNAKKAFKLLQKEQAEIEKVTGALDWQELPGKQDCRIRLNLSGVNITKKSEWNNTFNWLNNSATKFIQAFAPRIKALPLLDTVDLVKNSTILNFDLEE